MRNVLMISRCFPPLFDVGGKRAYRFAKYLPQYGWNPIVWTAPVPNGQAVDDSLDTGGITVVRTLEPRWWPKRYARHTIASEAIKAPDSGNWNFRRMLTVPLGYDVALVPRAAILLARLSTQYAVDAILTSAGPPIAFVYGWVAHRLSGAPLLLDYRDPWSLNYLQKRKPRWVRQLECMAEAALVRRADRIIFTSEDAAAAYRRMLPPAISGRITTITNSFDPAFRVSAPYPTSGPFKIVHFGHCNGKRTLAPVLHAIAELRDRWPANGVELLNFGRLRADDLELAAALKMPKLIKGVTLANYRTGIQELADANLLILLGYGDEGLCTPAKTFDYLLTERPILCIATGSSVRRLIEDTGSGRSFHPGDRLGIRDAINAAFRGAHTTVEYGADRAAIERYSSLETAKVLAGVLDEAVVKKSLGRRARTD